MTTQKIKIWKCSHCSPITIFSLYANVYKHVNGDSTQGEKEKSQYQDTICRGRKWWQTLRSAIWLHSRSNSFTAKREDLWGISTHGKNFPFMERTFPSWKELSLQVFRVDDGWYTYPSALTDIILCLTMIFATLLVHCGWSMKQYTCELKIPLAWVLYL